MEIEYKPKALQDIAFWKKSGNKTVMSKITKLIDSIIESPYSGLGKPEALKYELVGLWSRRITNEHRLVYEVFPDYISVISMKGHYEK